VRTLERRIAAVCRAVAVRVTEYNTRKRVPPSGEVGSENKDAGEVVDVVDASAINLPPEMPIVIDEHALEDILGVRSWSVFVKLFYCCHGYGSGCDWPNALCLVLS